MEAKGRALLRDTSTGPPMTDTAKCIICQNTTTKLPSSTERGRKRVLEAASLRNDIVTKRLKSIGYGTFVYHVSNECYKNYTLQKSLDNLKKDDASADPGLSAETFQRSGRSQSVPRPPPTKQILTYKQPCVVYGHVTRLGTYEKFRISECDRAEKFLKATVYFQDLVYARTCDLQDTHAVYGADIYCHKACINSYLVAYGRAISSDKGKQKHVVKLDVWARIIAEIEPGLNTGEGYELSDIRDRINALVPDSSTVTNREVKVLLTNYFGDNISFALPKLVSKSVMVFSRSCTAEHLVESIRSTDPVHECGNIIRQALIDYDFGLQDKFCDAHDLETAWQNMSVPDPILKFFGALYNFDPTSYHATTFDSPDDDSPVSEIDAGSKCSSKNISNAKCRQVQALFQVMYYNLHRGRKKTLLHVMNSQIIHDTCKSSTLIKSFNHFGLCSSYDELMRYRRDIASYTVEVSAGKVPLPGHFNPEMFTTAAFDNFDHEEATLSGIGGSHDTVSVLFQEKSVAIQNKPNVSDTTVSHGVKIFHSELPCQKLKDFHKPTKRPGIPEDYSVDSDVYSMSMTEKNNIATTDSAWILARLDLGETDSNNIHPNPEQQHMPSWSASNSVLTKENLPVKVVGFIPLIPNPVTEYSTVYTALKNFQEILSQLEQSQLAVTCDEGVYRIARDIQLSRPSEFQNLILCMGSFHMIKILLACLGKYLRNSGAEGIWIESSVFGVNVVESVLCGKNYARSVKGMQLLSEALRRLQWCEFFKQYGVENYQKQLEIIRQLRIEVAANRRTEALEMLQTFVDCSDVLFNDFDEFVKVNRDKNEIFLYWDTFIQLTSLLDNLIRSDREGNWQLHLDTVQAILPLFAAFDFVNYLRWCTLYLEDMRRLPTTAPEIHQRFLDGSFVTKRTPGHFKAVGADMCLEQTINKSQKSSSGIIGSSRRKTFVAEWEIIYHEMLAVSNLHRELSGIKTNTYELMVNHEFSKSETDLGEMNVQAMVSFIERCENPFSITTSDHRLHNILTQQVMPDDVRKELLTVRDIGASAYNKIRKERFVDKSVKLNDTIHRTNLKTFHTLQAQKTKSSGKASVQKEFHGSQRTFEIAKARGYSMEELLTYDKSPSLYLFDSSGWMTKPVKSSLIQELESSLNADDYIDPEPSDDCHITCLVDVMSIVRKVKSNSVKTFADLCDSMLNLVRVTAKNAQRIDLVFYSYVDGSIKDAVRQRRATVKPIELGTINASTPLPVDMKTFWPSSSNKRKLQILLRERAMEMFRSTYPNVQLVVSHIAGDQTLPCMSTLHGHASEIVELKNDLDEADTRIIPHTMHATKAETTRVVVLSSDSDVIVLMLYFWSEFYFHGLKELYVKAGVGETTRYIPIHTLSRKLGQEVCKVLPAVHSLTGCDYTSKFGTKHAAMKANPVLYLSDFGTNPDYVNIDNVMNKAEEYLTQVFKQGTK